MAQDRGLSQPLDLTILRYKCDTLKDAVSQASRATAVSFTSLIVLFSVFALLIYGDMMPEQVPVPVLALTLRRWQAAALGPPLICFAALNFACARALLQMRIKLLIPHLDLLFGADESTVTSQEFVGAVLHPSVHTIIDFLYVKNWRGFRVVIGILLSLWFLVPIAIIHMACMVLINYHWNRLLVAFYILTLVVGVYSFSHLMRTQQSDSYFDFDD